MTADHNPLGSGEEPANAGDDPAADEEKIAAYRAAVNRLPPLTRMVFLLHRVEDLAYGEIADLLSIPIAAVECCIVEALLMLWQMLDGEQPRRWRRQQLAEAEAQLRERYRSYCEGRLREIGAVTPIPWDDDADDEATAMRASRAAIWTAEVQQRLLERVANFDAAAPRKSIFRMIFRWSAVRAILTGIREISRPPLTFEEWLHGLSR